MGQKILYECSNCSTQYLYEVTKARRGFIGTSGGEPEPPKCPECDYGGHFEVDRKAREIYDAQKDS